MRIGILALALTVTGCMASGHYQSAQPKTNLYVTAPVGAVGEHYTARVTYSSNFIKTPEYSYNGDIPPGLTFDSYRGVLKGTPTKPGVWSFQFRVRDNVRGTHDQPAGQSWSYYEDCTIRIAAGGTAGGYVAGGGFPQPTTVGRYAGPQALWEVENKTAYAVTVSYNGAASGSLIVGAFATRSMNLPAGSYSVSASSGKPGVKPYGGSVSFQSGWRYRNSFFIKDS